MPYSIITPDDLRSLIEERYELIKSARIKPVHPYSRNGAEKRDTRDIKFRFYLADVNPFTESFTWDMEPGD